MIRSTVLPYKASRVASFLGKGSITVGRERPGSIRFDEIRCGVDKSRICSAILRQLPDWFGLEFAIGDYERKVKSQWFLAAFAEDKPVGFISIEEHNLYTSEIHVMGILGIFQGHGLGSELLRVAEAKLRMTPDKQFLMVKTLSDTHPDPHYRQTRRFYRKMGFYPLAELTALWGEENPCLLMVKTLRP